VHKPGDRPGDLPAGSVPESEGVPEVAPVPQRMASPHGGAAADTAAPSRDPAPPSADTYDAERRTGLAAGPQPPAGAERLRQDAFETAWRFLAHRERTEAELVARLERNDVEPQLIEEVLDELRQGGYVDDAGFARRFAEDKRNLEGWGAERIERRLHELGVDRHHIHAALAHDDEHDELAQATGLLQRRFPTPPETPQELERALGFLVRKGYELELAYDAVRRLGALALDE